ncbi:MAG: DUF3084 domain-containing protein [Abditibacteriaceae bacterium]
MTLAILLIVLVIATSFIAYWSDNLGKKLGKKRISLFGIRPKQTATLISIFSSVGIMLLTVGVLLATFSNLRNALLRYDSARRTAIELRQKNNELVKSNGGLLNQQRTLNKQLSELKQASAKAVKQRLAAMRQLAKIRADLKQASKAEQRAQQGEKAAKAKANSAQQRYAQVVLKLQDAQHKVESSQILLAQTLDKLQSTNKSLAKANNDFKATRLQLTKASAQLQVSQKSLASVQRNFELVDQQVKTTLDQYRDAARNVEKLKQRSDDLETQLKVQQQQLTELTFVAKQVATGNVEVAYGTVFAQTLIPSKTNPAITKAQLQALLKTGQNAVQGKYTLTLEPQQVYVDQQKTVLRGDQIIDYLSRQVSISDVTVSARLIAARDHAIGEQEISTRFILVPVRTIFQKNDVVEESQIDATSGDARIFNQLLSLVNQGEAKARDKGSLPITTQDSPFYAAGTNERIFEALRQIQTHTGTVDVKMITSQNITTIDPMQVQFVVTDNSSPSS